jgi:hypothetical protein
MRVATALEKSVAPRRADLRERVEPRPESSDETKSGTRIDGLETFEKLEQEGRNTPMQCAEFERILEQGSDGSLPAAAASHLEACPVCNFLWDDLQAIRHAGGQLAAEESAPPERVWTALRARLEAEGLVHTAPTPGWLSAWLGQTPRMVLAGAYAAVMLIAVTFATYTNHDSYSANLLASRRLTLSAAPLESGLGPTLDGNLKQVMASLPERDIALANSFQHNLGIVDDLIAVCEKSVRELPDDPVARDYLYGAYQQKAVLLATAMDRSTMEDR